MEKIKVIRLITISIDKLKGKLKQYVELRQGLYFYAKINLHEIVLKMKRIFA